MVINPRVAIGATAAVGLGAATNIALGAKTGNEDVPLAGAAIGAGTALGAAVALKSGAIHTTPDIAAVMGVGLVGAGMFAGVLPAVAAAREN